MNEAVKYSFDLNEDMIKLLKEEFHIRKPISRFMEAMKDHEKAELEAIGRQVFEIYGKDWMRRTIELGDMYPDTTYEMILEANDKTGDLAFPYFPQRSIEIAYLSTKDILKMNILENNRERLVYRLDNCSTYNELLEECGEEVTKLLPCRYACLTACETLKEELNMSFGITMEYAMPAEGFCQFTLESSPGPQALTEFSSC